MKNTTSKLLLSVALSLSLNAWAADPNIIRIQAPISQGSAAAEPAEPSEQFRDFSITVGYHPNPNCAYKMRGYGVTSICTGKSGSFGAISNNQATIGGNQYTVPQIIGWKNGSACMYSFMVSSADYDAVPATIQTTWNGIELTQTKSTRGLPGVITWDTAASCDLYDSLMVGDALRVVLKES